MHQRVAALQQEVDRLRLLLENTTDVASTATNDGLLTWVSDSVTSTLGWNPQDLEGRFLREFVHPEDYLQLVAGLPALRNGEPTRADLRVRAADGGYRWISLMRRQLFDEQGEPTYRVGGWRDITSEREAHHAMERSQEFQRTLLDAMLEPYVLLLASRDRTGEVIDFTFTDANPAALAVYGMAREELLGQSLTTLHPSVASTGLLDMYVSVVNEGAPMVLDDWSYPQDLVGGQELRYDVRAVRVGDAVMQVWRDVTSRYESARRLEHLALHDGLTGAFNHTAALQQLDSTLQESRSPGEHVAVVFCDTDMFKEINDTHGHATGDRVLVELANRIKQCVRHEDLVARMGGDEFMVVLTGVHSVEDVVHVAEKIRAACEIPVDLAGVSVRTSLSIGVALSLESEPLDRLLERADRAMYRAKRAGRNQVAA